MEFKTKYEETLDQSSVSSFKEVNWSNYKNVIESILKKQFPKNSSVKWRVDVKRDRLNFACPYCGDSDKHDRKKRANIYFGNTRFKCFNSPECPSPNLRNFLKDFDSLDEIDLSEISKLIEIEKSYVPSKFKAGFSTQIIEDNLISSYALSLDEVVSGLKLLNLSPWLGKYLTDRLQVIDNKFWMDSGMNLWILNIVNDKVLGAQIRSFKSGNHNKYTTYKLNKLYDILDKEIPDTEEFEMLDEVSQYYNWFNVNTDHPIIVFEGPLDSFLMKNAVAQCSITAQLDTSIGEFYFMYDNDKTGRSALINKLNDGYSVFLWNKFIKDYNLPISIKDFNDVLLELKKQGKKYPSDILDYFSKSKYDLYDL